VEEKGEGDGVEQFPDRDSEELGMQFSLVHRAGYLTIPRLPKQVASARLAGLTFSAPCLLQ